MTCVFLVHDRKERGMKKLNRLWIAPVTALALTACGGGGSSSDEMIDEETMTGDTVLLEDGVEDAVANVTVEDAWARTNPMSPDMGSIYVILTSETDDAVLYADVDFSIAMSTEVHETLTAADGSMTTQIVESVPLPAGQPVTFEPGGIHLVLMGLVEPLVAGNVISVTLTLESGNLVTFDAEVREDAE
jgi:copper(I)-binding protein